MIGQKYFKNKLSKKVLVSIKVCVTIILCVFIVYSVDWKNVQYAIKDSNIWLILIVFFCMLLNVTVSAFKWQILLIIHGIHLGIVRLNRYYLIAMFFNNFLPTSIGGDGYRIFKVIQGSHSKTGTVVSVFMERYIGIFVLCFFGFVGAIVSYLNQGDDTSRLGIIYIFLGLCVAVSALILITHERSQLWLLRKHFIPQKIKNVIERFGDYRKNKAKFLLFILMSMFFYVILFSCRLMLIHAVGGTCSIFSLALVVMLCNMVAMLPISINGIGLVEGSFAYLISKFGVSYETGIIVMILSRVLAVLISLLGGIFYFKDKPSPRVAES